MELSDEIYLISARKKYDFLRLDNSIVLHNLLNFCSILNELRAEKLNEENMIFLDWAIAFYFTMY